MEEEVQVLSNAKKDDKSNEKYLFYKLVNKMKSQKNDNNSTNNETNDYVKIVCTKQFKISTDNKNMMLTLDTQGHTPVLPTANCLCEVCPT